jgi:hypothetical protein
MTVITENESESASEVKAEVKSILSSIKSALAEGDNMGILGDSNGGVVEGLLLGSLVGGNGMFGRNNNNGNFNDNNHRSPVDAGEVQNIVATNGIQGTVNALKGEIWQAEGQVQLAVAGSTNAFLQGQTGLEKSIAGASQTSQVTQLQGQIANLQGQAGLAGDISRIATETALGLGVLNTAVANQAGILGVNIVNATAKTDALVSTATNLINTNLLQGEFRTAQVIVNEGEKTRNAIAALQAFLPNSRELDLQRQLAVAESDLRHDRTAAAIRSGNVEVTTTVNQAQAQAQQQQQIWNINAQLADVLAQQKITQGIINVGGTLTSGTQSAANTRL